MSSEKADRTESPLLVGVMGGMFDPVHLGHLQAARCIRDYCNLDSVRLIPCGNPVHRAQAQASAMNRCEMLQLALAGQHRLQLDRRECESSAPSRTVDTLLSLKQDMPASTLVLVIGMDAFAGLTSWYHWELLFELAHLVVVTRPGYTLENTQANAALNALLSERQCLDPAAFREQVAGKIHIAELATMSLSSSEVRAALAKSEPVTSLLPASVVHYIYEHHLYQSGVKH